MKRMILGVLLASVLWFAACTVPAWVNTVEDDAEIAAPIAASLIDVVDPALAPVVTLVENGFSALVKTLDTYKASPSATNLQAVQSAFAAVNSNVAQLESAAQIKNAGTAGTVTQVVALLSQAVAEIAAMVPAPVAAQADVKVGVQAVPKQWKAKDFKKAFDQIAKHDSRLKEL
jgi:xanthine/uracil/vitamin C permease (AzgA family)